MNSSKLFMLLDKIYKWYSTAKIDCQWPANSGVQGLGGFCPPGLTDFKKLGPSRVKNPICHGGGEGGAGGGMIAHRMILTTVLKHFRTGS